MLSNISLDIRPWASKILSLLGRNEPLSNGSYIVENHSFSQKIILPVLLSASPWFTVAIVLLYKEIQGFISQGSVHGNNIPTGSWPASSPKKDIIFSVMFPTSLERSHLFSHTPALPNLAGLCLNCLCLSLPFQKTEVLISDIPLQAPHLFYFCHWYQPLLSELIIKMVIFSYINMPLLSEWEKVWMLALKDVLLWSLFATLASFQERRGIMLMFTGNAVIPIGFA